MLSNCPVLVGYPLKPKKTLFADWAGAACMVEIAVPNSRGSKIPTITIAFLVLFIPLFLALMAA